MIDYIYENYGLEYDSADASFQRSCVSGPYIKYLFKPGDVLVQGIGADRNGYMLKTWPRLNSLGEEGLKATGKDNRQSEWSLEVSSWSFNGSFKRINSRLTLSVDDSDKIEHAIKELNIRPIKYASREDVKTLQKRGEMFWKCRERHFVSYQERGRGDLHSASSSEERFMIDLKTFRDLHPEEEKNKFDENVSFSESFDKNAMAQERPPDPSFLYLLPQKIIGYNMRRRKWVKLNADWLSKVIWDKKAFQKLVLEQKTKDLIEALIVSQISAEKSTDLISGKGNGLILLLHGGPGTGKNLTAESVAEIAEKPLYRVTCGDIGLEPEEVEQYLNSVLGLGKIWSYVVLLDETNVFLEERSMSDVKRNALVSVFFCVYWNTTMES
ncbi:putative Lon protease [Glarea lozoyensis 74030]|nr:putative Lon protease [Glarea lozoyensis 74030]